MKKNLILLSLLLAFFCFPAQAQQAFSLPVSHIEAEGKAVKKPSDFSIKFSVSDSPFGLGRQFNFNVEKNNGMKLIIGNSVIGSGYFVAQTHMMPKDKPEIEDNMTILSSFNLISYPNGDRKKDPDKISMIALMRNNKTQKLTINIFYKIFESTIPQDVKSCLIQIPYTPDNWTKLKDVITATFK